MDQLRQQAKELLESFLTGEEKAVAEVSRFYHDADAAQFALHDAQLVLARSYGFDSWPKLKAYVDGMTVERLTQAVRANNLEQVRAILRIRPELVNVVMAWNNEHTALHYAVLDRMPEMVRVLMKHGANARAGISPHNDATAPSPLPRRATGGARLDHRAALPDPAEPVLLERQRHRHGEVVEDHRDVDIARLEAGACESCVAMWRPPWSRPPKLDDVRK